MLIFVQLSWALWFYSAADTKVPGRGKALIPTDLSIAVSPGTYARIGKPLVNFFCQKLNYYT